MTGHRHDIGEGESRCAVTHKWGDGIRIYAGMGGRVWFGVVATEMATGILAFEGGCTDVV